MKPIATIILNRNLPKVTDKLYSRIKKNEGHMTDIFIVEAGSLKKNLSKYATWHANSKTVRQKGLRFPRGMNYGLYQMWKEKIFTNLPIIKLIVIT